MKSLKLIIAFLFVISIIGCSEKSSNDEQEIRKILALYDEAATKNDATFFEEYLASDYLMANPDGAIIDKAASLKYMNDEIENPSYKLVSLKSDSIQVKTHGDIAVVTGKWLSTIQAVNDPSPVMHDDEGRFTSILERRNGKWMMVTEHVSEKPHNKQELEKQLKIASDNFDKGLLTKDRKLFEDLFADDFESTGREGRLINKEEGINQIMSPDLVILTSATDDKKFRIYRNTAVETGRFSESGSYKGKPFSEVGRYTSTWVNRDGKWKMVADHTSLIPVSK